MKKIGVWALAVALAVPAWSGAESAKKISLGLNAGYTTVGMGDLNDSLQETYDAWDNPKKTTLDKVSGGLVVGLEGGYMVTENVLAGVRAGMVVPGTGKVDESTGSATKVFSVATSLVPVEVGGRYIAPISEKVSLTGGAFAGYGIGSGSYKTEITSSESSEWKFEGSGLVVDLVAGAGYKVTPTVTIGIELGYRIMTAPLTWSEDADFDGDGVADVKSGDDVKNTAGDKVEFDFSGVAAALTVSLLF